MKKEFNKNSCHEYVENKANKVLGPLLIDLMKEQPDDILNYMIKWCQTTGKIHALSTSNRSSFKENITAPTNENKIAKYITSKNSIDRLRKDSILQIQKINDNMDFDQKIMDRIKNRKKKNAISAEVYGEYNKISDFKPPVIHKSISIIRKIKDILSKSFMFDSLDDSDLKIIIDAMRIRNFTANETVIKQGDNGEELFVVSEGQLKCCKRFEDTNEVYLRNYEVGQVFGELSLFYNTPRAASIYAVTASVCFSLDRETFTLIVKRSAIDKRANMEETIKKIDILKGLTYVEICKITDCLQTEKYKKGDYIVKEGDDGDKMYFIQQGGAVALKRDNNNSEKIVYEFKDNDYFGEIAIVERFKRKASIKVVSDSLIALSLTRDSFNRVMGDIQQLFKERTIRYNNFIPK